MPLLLLQPRREAHIKKDGHQNYDRQAFQIVDRAAQDRARPAQGRSLADSGDLAWRWRTSKALIPRSPFRRWPYLCAAHYCGLFLYLNLTCGQLLGKFLVVADVAAPDASSAGHGRRSRGGGVDGGEDAVVATLDDGGGRGSLLLLHVLSLVASLRVAVSEGGRDGDALLLGLLRHHHRVVEVVLVVEALVGLHDRHGRDGSRDGTDGLDGRRLLGLVGVRRRGRRPPARPGEPGRAHLVVVVAAELRLVQTQHLCQTSCKGHTSDHWCCRRATD